MEDETSFSIEASFQTNQTAVLVAIAEQLAKIYGEMSTLRTQLATMHGNEDDMDEDQRKALIEKLDEQKIETVESQLRDLYDRMDELADGMSQPR
jgi:uncharacterized coiled-coil protein SlyX